jgi:transcriptional regulator with XRE-family HTH domain
MAAKDFTKRFGERLRDLRIREGLSQEELAHAAGLHRTHISLIERNHRSVRLESLERLATALGVQPSSLVPDVDLTTNGSKTNKDRPSRRQGKAG